jgi:N4-gp56 family major capsid protein
MAGTSYGVNHPLAQKAWAKDLFHDVIGESYWGRFMGTGKDNLCQIKSETQKDAGDKITFGLRGLLTGDGVQGDSTLEGNEEALTTYNDSVFIDQLRHAVRSAGKMSEQRVPFSVRKEAKDGLKEWWIERLETSLANQLTGNTGQTDTKYTGNQATVAPSATFRIICGGGHATEASLSASTTHAISLFDLDRAVALARAPQTSGGKTYQRMRPLNIDGKKLYVAFLHPWQIRMMRKDAATAGNFFDIQKAQLSGGKISDNPILTGGEFIHNGVIVHEWSYLPTIAGSPNSGAAADFRRGVFCGAQACAVAFGQNSGPTKMSWEEELFDYGNQLGVSAGMIFGAKKTQFNGIDFATIVLSGYAPSP